MARIFPNEHGLLRYGNRAVLQFYVLHYPVLAVTAYYLIPLNLSLAARTCVLALTSFILTLVAADLLTRRCSNSVRALHLGL